MGCQVAQALARHSPHFRNALEAKMSKHAEAAAEQICLDLIDCLVAVEDGPRPTDFSAREGSNRVLMVLQRADATSITTSRPGTPTSSAIGSTAGVAPTTPATPAVTAPTSVQPIQNLPAPPSAPPLARPFTRSTIESRACALVRLIGW